jgi:hypothetical protein
VDKAPQFECEPDIDFSTYSIRDFFARLVLKYYDEPVRSWLNRRYWIKRATVKVPGKAGEAR